MAFSVKCQLCIDQKYVDFKIINNSTPPPRDEIRHMFGQSRWLRWLRSVIPRLAFSFIFIPPKRLHNVYNKFMCKLSAKYGYAEIQIILELEP